MVIVDAVMATDEMCIQFHERNSRFLVHLGRKQWEMRQSLTKKKGVRSW
jgi:hypothetical protein